ncbi:MAG: hypothetical protein IKV90_03785, partial [Clostridia bacterium]|nr:hypothetical protein [Clostridia bacterium]
VRKRKGSGESRGMEGPERSEAKAEDKGESEEAAAEIEADGRRKEIADEASLKLSGSRKAETKA